MRKTKYRVKVGNLWIKSTCRFGPFHGSIVLTRFASEARKFTRESDANSCAHCVAYRVSAYPGLKGEELAKGKVITVTKVQCWGD